MSAQNYIGELPPYALWAFSLATLGWVIGPLIGYRLGLRSKAEERRHSFRGIIALNIDKFQRLVLPQTPAGSLYREHRDSCGVIAPEAVKIEQDIRWHKRSRFKKAREEYRALRLEDVEPHDSNNWPLEPRDAMKFAFPNLEAGRSKIIDLLKEMVEYAR